MATAADVTNEWAADSEAKQLLIKTRSGLVLRWLNQGQLRFADLSEMLKGEWQPTVTASGNIALPADFLREYPGRVKYDLNSTVNAPLIKIDYQDAINLDFTGDTTHYSIFNVKLYVWAAGALTPSIPYIKKPVALTTLASDDLGLSTEFHYEIIAYLDAMWAAYNKEISFADKNMMLKDFDSKAREHGLKFLVRQGGALRTRSQGF